jgi:MFS family permease
MKIEKSSRHTAGGSYRSLDRNIHILFIARIINRFGDFVQMLLVLILTLSIGMDEHLAGWFTTMTLLAGMLGQLLGGFAADRYPRTSVMVSCQLIVALLYIICGLLVGSQAMVVAVLILVSAPFRGATWPVSHALIADFSHGEMERARAFSLLYLGSNIGVAVGPLVAAFLFSRNLPLLFLISALTLVLSASLLGFFLPKQRQKEAPDGQSATDVTTVSLWNLFFSNRMLLLYLIAFILYNLIYVQHSFALPLQMNQLFGSLIGPERYGWIMTVNAVTVLLMTAFVTRWTLTWSRSVNMALGMVFYVIGFGVYAFCSSFALFLAATFIWTIGEILLATNGNVFVNQHAPASHRGRFNSIVSVSMGFGSSIGPALGGLLLSVASFRTLWLGAVLVAGIIGLLFIRLRILVIRSSQ